MKKANSIFSLFIALFININCFSQLAGYKIVIDPGHGGGQNGTTCVNGEYEKKLNLEIGLKLRDILQRRGATVVMTRTTDKQFVETGDDARRDVEARMDFINKENPDVAISIHLNGTHLDPYGNILDEFGINPSVLIQGTKTLWGNGTKSKSFAEKVYARLVIAIDYAGLGVDERNDLAVLKTNSSIPTIITESLYITNAEGCYFANSSINQSHIAEAHADGIQDYLYSLRPDLTPVSQSISENSIQAGSSLTVYCAEDNSGKTPAGANVVSIHLSEDNVLTPGANGDKYIGEIDIPNVAANSCSIIYSESITIPSNISPGIYYLFFSADGGEAVSEIFEDNNYATVQLTISGSGTILNPPRNLSATIDNGQTTLSWTAPSSGTPSSYKVYRSTSENGTYSSISSNITSTSKTITGLTNGTSYWFYVKAIYETGESTASNKVSAVPTTSTTPSNDDCSGAILLTSSTSCNYIENQTVNNATHSGKTKGSCDAYTGTPALADVWYYFQAQSASQSITVDPNGSQLDAVIVSYNSCSDNSIIGCSDVAGGNGALSTLNLSGLTIGNYYYIRVYDYGLQTTDGNFRICVTGESSSNDGDCTITSISPNSETHGSDSYSTDWGEIIVNGQPYCSFTVSGICDWLTVWPMSGTMNSNTTGTIGQAFLDYSIEENLSTEPRHCTFYINGNPITITQNGIEQEDCTAPSVIVNDNSGNSPLTMTCFASGGSGDNYSYKWYSGTSCSGTVLGTGSTLNVTASGYYSCKAYISGFESTCYSCSSGYADCGSSQEKTICSWKYKANMPIGIYSAASATYGNYIYIIGGNSSKKFYQYDVINDIFLTKSPIDIGGTDESQAVVLSDKIYLCHGFSDEYVRVYDILKDSWAKKSKRPIGSFGRYSVFKSVNNYIYAIGGCDYDSNPSSQLDQYDPANDSWTTINKPMPTARFAASSVVYNNMIYVIGGKTSNGVTNVVEVYNPSSNKWTTKSPMPDKRVSAFAELINNKIYVIGGFTGSKYTNTIQEYNITTDSWTTVNLNPSFINVLDAAIGVVNDKIYVIGGSNSDGTIASTEELDLCPVSNYTISTSSNPSTGGTTSGGGTYQSDQLIIVTATANNGYTFSNWTENGTSVSTNASYSFTISGNRNLVANFTQNVVNYTISTSSNPSTGGTTSGGGTYQSDQSIIVTATANNGYTFSNWTENGTSVSTNASYSFTISGNRNLVANFTQNVVNYTISTSSNPSTGGKTSGGGTYQSDQSIIVTATATNGYTFSYWSENGTSVSTNANYTFTVSGNRSLIANFITSPNNGKTVTDIDGNVYSTVTIGSQVWLGQNLKTTKYNDGTSVQLVTENNNWGTISTPAYCWYNNDIGNKNPYGALYNWYAINTGRLCPQGWHVPSDSEWTIFTNYLGGASISGGKLKEDGLTHWLSPNSGAINSANFSALPGGNRNYFSGDFYGLGNGGDWWSNTEDEMYNAWHRSIVYNNSGISRLNPSKSYGFSVRCLCDLLSTSTSELANSNKIVYYPNPTKGLVYISSDKSIEGEVRIEVYSNLGVLLQSLTILQGNETPQIDLSRYSPGIYLIKIDTNNKNFLGKIIKQ